MLSREFQVQSNDADVQQKARQEFDDFVRVLQNSGVDVTVVEDTALPHTPDSIFPNNWVSFHSDGTILLYPMYAVNRRAERKDAPIEDPKGDLETWAFGECRVLRGGSWYDVPMYCRAAVQLVGKPFHSKGDMGFRVVLRSSPRAP